MNPRLQDVAREAGVSVTTASYALNNRPGIPEKTRQKVLQAATHLGYAPDLKARSLARGRPPLVGIAFRDPEHLQSRTHAAGWIAGVLDELQSREFALGILTREELARKQSLLAGLIVVEPGEDFPSQEMIQSGLPILCIGRPPNDETSLSWVDIDHGSATYHGAKFLLQMGHRDVLLATDIRSSPRLVEDYLEGLHLAMDDAGLPTDRYIHTVMEAAGLPPPSVTSSAGTRPSDEGLILQALAALQAHRTITGVLAETEAIALAWATALERNGFGMPEALSVFCLSGSCRAHCHRLSFDSIVTDPVAMGAIAARRLVDRIRKRSIQATRSIRPFEIQSGGTCGPPGPRGSIPAPAGCDDRESSQEEKEEAR